MLGNMSGLNRLPNEEAPAGDLSREAANEEFIGIKEIAQHLAEARTLVDRVDNGDQEAIDELLTKRRILQDYLDMFKDRRLEFLGKELKNAKMDINAEITEIDSITSRYSGTN